MIEKNVELESYKKLSPWRKIAIGTWRTAYDPSIYGILELEAEPILRACKKYKDQGIKVTPTTVMAKAAAYAIRKYPGINGVLRFGRIYRRKNVDIFLQVSEGDNLTGIKILEADKKELDEIGNEIQTKVQKIMQGNDEQFGKSKKTMNFLPGYIVGPLLTFLSKILYALNIWSPILGVPKDGFGSAMVTSVGMMGVEKGFAPLVPYSRCPIVLAVGAIKETPVVENGEIVIKKLIPLCATLDHRLIDGYGASRMIYYLKEYLRNLDK